MKIVTSFLLFICSLLLFSSYSIAALPGFMQQRTGTLSGQIYVDGSPKPFALVSFFQKEHGLPPISDGMRRVPEFLSRTDAEGKFKIDMVVGEYYIGVLPRQPGDVTGPPREGEKFYFVSEEHGELRVLTIKLHETVDKGRLNAVVPESFNFSEEYFTVEGTVLDETGTPIRGMVVLGKHQLNIPRPEFISNRTDANGLYQIKLPPNRAFYLVARETIAGAKPIPGSSIGTYGIVSKTGLAAPSIFGSGSPPPGVINVDNSNKALTVSGGANEKISNVNIFMYTVPDPEEIRASIQGTVNSPKFQQVDTLNDISFENNNHRLDRKSFKELDIWASFLKGREDIKVELVGHSDNQGNPEYNLHLSVDRAHAVAEYLVSKGIMPDRLIVRGVGSDHPIASNDTQEGQSQNRRVEIKIID